MIGTPKRVAAAHPDAGMRRVSWVRIEFDAEGAARCQVLGIGHRLPLSRPVSLATALDLAAGGVPTLLRSADGSAELLPAR